MNAQTPTPWAIGARLDTNRRGAGMIQWLTVQVIAVVATLVCVGSFFGGWLVGYRRAGRDLKQTYNAGYQMGGRHAKDGKHFSLDFMG